MVALDHWSIYLVSILLYILHLVLLMIISNENRKAISYRPSKKVRSHPNQTSDRSHAILSHLMSKNDPPVCTSCITSLTIKHIMTDCRLYSEQRSISKLPEHLSESLYYNRFSLTATIEFIRKTNLQNKL